MDKTTYKHIVHTKMTTTTFADLKKSRKSNFDELTKKVEQLISPTRESFSDDRFWLPTIDKAGNGYNVIRFLPAKAGESYPWISYFDHGFQGPTGLWYIEKSLTTIGGQDPLGDYNSKLWNSGVEANKEQARKQKRRLHYVSNIYVVSDSAHPENEGKIFLFQYGKKLFQKINEAMNPQYEDETPINPFDFWEGANFKLKIRNYEGYRNYDKSEFDTTGPLFDDDKKLEKIYNDLYSLSDFLDPKNFKTYEELEKKLNKVLFLEDNEPRQKAEVPTPQESRRSINDKIQDDDDDSIDTDFFKRLAQED